MSFRFRFLGIPEKKEYLIGTLKDKSPIPVMVMPRMPALARLSSFVLLSFSVFIRELRREEVIYKFIRDFLSICIPFPDTKRFPSLISKIGRAHISTPLTI